MPVADRLLTFGEYFSQILVSCGYWKEEDVPVLGFAHLDHFKEKANDLWRANRKTDKLCVMISTGYDVAWVYQLWYWDYPAGKT